MKVDMKRITVKMLLVAAGTIAPHLVVVGAPALEAKNVESLSAGERSILKLPECKAIYSEDTSNDVAD